MPRVVIGVGNPYRRDDGVGLAVLDRLRDRIGPGVRLVVTDGEPTQLIDAWAGAELAIVVDAVLCEPAEPGRVHRSDAVGAPAGTPGGTHALGIPDAIRLAEVLERMPRRLAVYAVEAAELGFGAGLTPAVEAAVPAIVAAVLDELTRGPAPEPAGPPS